LTPDPTPLASPGERRLRTRFGLLLAAPLLVAGLFDFDLRTSAPLEIALQWLLVFVAGFVAVRLFRLWRRSGLGRKPDLDLLFRVSVAGAVGSAHLLFLLHLTVRTQPYEVERYLRALALSGTVCLFANAAVIFVLMALPYLLTGRLRASVLLGLLVTAALHVLHVGKYLILQQHLYPWDHMLATDVLEVLPRLMGSSGLAPLWVALTVLLALVLLVALRERLGAPLARRVRILAGGLLAVGLVLVATRLPENGEDPAEYFPLWNRHSYDSHHNKGGLLLTLLRGTRHLTLNQPPPGYSRAAMARIEQAHPQRGVAQAPRADVILYMVESLSDGSAYGIEYAQDPLANFHALGRSGTAARLVVPIYGGNTPNTEFEVLTGLSRVEPWPYDLAYAYRQWITADTPALPWVFRDWGYRTAVVSGATSRYFGEAEAYPRLGFQQFRALGDRPESARKFGLVSDEAVVDELIRMLEEGGDGRAPWFLAVTTDATHGPYRGDHDPGDGRFTVTGRQLPEGARAVAEDYGRAVNHADAALGRLATFLRTRRRPTVLCVYGDHKPAIPEYFAAGLFRTDWPGAVIDKYSTPLVIWTNVEGTPAAPPTPPLLSANFLAFEVFARLGVDPPPSTFVFAREVYARFNVVSRVIGDRQERYHRRAELEGADADLLRDYGFVKYDTLVGRSGR